MQCSTFDAENCRKVPRDLHQHLKEVTSKLALLPFNLSVKLFFFAVNSFFAVNFFFASAEGQLIPK